MADIHVTKAAGDGWQIVMHFATPAGNNSVGSYVRTRSWLERVHRHKLQCLLGNGFDHRASLRIKGGPDQFRARKLAG